MLPQAVLPPGDHHTEIIEKRREAMGYNKPYVVQFAIFLKNIVTEWDWGISDNQIYFGKDVAKLFASKLPITMIVNLYSIIWSIPVGIALGIWAALKKNKLKVDDISFYFIWRPDMQIDDDSPIIERLNLSQRGRILRPCAELFQQHSDDLTELL
jgi:ABC-type dipeptide/oligopeptide/nickel transport system permease component